MNVQAHAQIIHGRWQYGQHINRGADSLDQPIDEKYHVDVAGQWRTEKWVRDLEPPRPSTRYLNEFVSDNHTVKSIGPDLVDWKRHRKWAGKRTPHKSRMTTKMQVSSQQRWWMRKFVRCVRNDWEMFWGLWMCTHNYHCILSWVWIMKSSKFMAAINYLRLDKMSVKRSTDAEICRFSRIIDG